MALQTGFVGCGNITDTHVRVGASDLPATRRIISFENGQVIVKSLTFKNHKML